MWRRLISTLSIADQNILSIDSLIQYRMSLKWNYGKDAILKSVLLWNLTLFRAKLRRGAQTRGNKKEEKPEEKKAVDLYKEPIE